MSTQDIISEDDYLEVTDFEVHSPPADGIDTMDNHRMDNRTNNPQVPPRPTDNLQENNRFNNKLFVWIFGICALFETMALVGFSVTISILTMSTSPSGQCTSTIKSGITYVRWGRTGCPNTADLVYSGITGGSYFDDTGSGANLLCLPTDPKYVSVQNGTQKESARIYSTEYELFDARPELHNHEVPCAICTVPQRGRMIMIPAKVTCPTNWTSEYRGYLMAERADFHRGEYVCIDEFAEARPGGSSANEDGGLLGRVEGICNPGSLPCPPYINGNELTCVVCSF